MGRCSRDGQGQLSQLPSEELAELPQGGGGASIVQTAGHQWVRDSGGRPSAKGEAMGQEQGQAQRRAVSLEQPQPACKDAGGGLKPREAARLFPAERVNCQPAKQPLLCSGHRTGRWWEGDLEKQDTESCHFFMMPSTSA